jgi:ATP-dependent phosphoenolpyruvate carboxykinase
MHITTQHGEMHPKTTFSYIIRKRNAYMIAKPHVHSNVGLEEVGLHPQDIKNVHVHWNLNPSELYEHAIRNGEAELTNKGALRVLTGQYTGRSPKDKYFVEQSPSKEKNLVG